MSRVTAAAAGAATEIQDKIYLTLHVGPSDTALVVSNTASPIPNHTIAMKKVDFQAFRLFMLYLLRLNSGNPRLAIGRISPGRDTTLVILYFLYADIATLVAPQLRSPLKQLECTAEALRFGLPARDYSARPFVCLSDFSADLKANSLVNAALNADLEAVIGILEKTNPTKHDKLLRASSTAITTHCGSERTGTALQMALFSGDEAIVKALQPHMDPGEFQRQWIEVFGTNYKAFLERQKNQAVQLCAELESAFRGATDSDIANALNRVPETTSELQKTLSRFQEALEHYVRENPVHNPFIMETLLEIYNRLPAFDSNADELISRQVFGAAQKLSSMQWLQHYVQGFCNFDQQEVFSRETPRRKFSCRFSYNGLTLTSDVRSTSALSGLGVDFCIDPFGFFMKSSSWGVMRSYQNFCREKTSSLGETYAARAAEAWRAPVCSPAAQ
jgi:hypothetical protein